MHMHHTFQYCTEIHEEETLIPTEKKKRKKKKKKERKEERKEKEKQSYNSQGIQMGQENHVNVWVEMLAI